MQLTPDEDERVRDQGRSAQLRQVSDHRQGQEDDQFGEDEISRGDERLAVCHGENERLQILGDEDGVSCESAGLSKRMTKQLTRDETDLRNGDRREDR